MGHGRAYGIKGSRIYVQRFRVSWGFRGFRG